MQRQGARLVEYGERARRGCSGQGRGDLDHHLCTSILQWCSGRCGAMLEQYLDGASASTRGNASRCWILCPSARSKSRQGHFHRTNGSLSLLWKSSSRIRTCLRRMRVQSANRREIPGRCGPRNLVRADRTANETFDCPRIEDPAPVVWRWPSTAEFCAGGRCPDGSAAVHGAIG